MFLLRNSLYYLRNRRLNLNTSGLMGITTKRPKTSLHNTQEEEDVLDSVPIKYSQSNALKWKAVYSRKGKKEDERLWYEPYVISGSLAVLLLYFGVLREENDIDEELGRSLYSRIDGLEEHQLRLSLKYNLEHGEPTSDIVQRLKEIETEKAQNA